MASKHPNIWKRLQLIALALLLLGTFAPLPNTLDLIVTAVAGVLFLAFLGATWWEERREGPADQSSSAAISSSDQT